jgi:hypothetical protein
MCHVCSGCVMQCGMLLAILFYPHNRPLLCWVSYTVYLLTSTNSYNIVLFSTIHFPTRNHNGSSTAISNRFIDTFAFSNFKSIPIINGLSEHAQLLMIKDLHIRIGINYIKSIRMCWHPHSITTLFPIQSSVPHHSSSHRHTWQLLISKQRYPKARG